MAATETPADRVLGAFGATAAGVGGSLALVAVIWAAENASAGAGVELAAVMLAVCYATYGGVALTRGNSKDIAIENAFIGLGLVLVGLGLWHRPEWLALGWALHSIWDLLHHHDRHVLGVRGVPQWYVVTCLVWDPIVAVGILLVL